MKKSNHHTLRDLLRTHDDGLTIRQLCNMTGKTNTAIRRALKCMVDVYVDRWESAPRAKLAAVYVAVHVPDDCPMPEAKRKLG